MTSYFRHRFRTEKAYQNLVLALQHDGGVIVYLDGAEVLRDNVPVGKPEAYGLLATETISGERERELHGFRLDGAIEPGEHVLAISLHDCEGDRHDLRIAEISLWGAPRQE
jgi:hypothetical protein